MRVAAPGQGQELRSRLGLVDDGEEVRREEVLL